MRDLYDEYLEELRAEGLRTPIHEDALKDMLDAAHVERRVADWESRVNALFGDIIDWLPEGWAARRGIPVHWQAPFMCRFGIPEKQMPTLELHDQAGRSARLWPDGLWIYGANGRVNLDYGERHYSLYDYADNFAPPDWQAYEPVPKDPDAVWPQEAEVVSRDWLRGILQ